MPSGDPSRRRRRPVTRESSFVEPRAVPAPPAEIERRVAAFQRTLRGAGIEAALVVQNADLFYLAGTVQQSHLLVPAAGEPVLLTRKTVDRAREESPLAVAPLPSQRDLGELVARHCGGAPQVVGLELDVLPVTQFRRYESQFPGASLRRRRARCSWRSARSSRPGRSPASPPRRRSATKSAKRIPGLLREGMTEAAFAGAVEARARALGHQGVVRMRAFNGEMFYGQLLYRHERRRAVVSRHAAGRHGPERRRSPRA